MQVASYSIKLVTLIRPSHCQILKIHLRICVSQVKFEAIAKRKNIAKNIKKTIKTHLLVNYKRNCIFLFLLLFPFLPLSLSLIVHFDLRNCNWNRLFKNLFCKWVFVKKIERLFRSNQFKLATKCVLRCCQAISRFVLYFSYSFPYHFA